MKDAIKSKKFLIVVATHGNEAFSVNPIIKLQGLFRKQFDVEIGNPLALKGGQRYIDCDLNRVAPGSSSSKKYEMKRASYLLKKSKQYNFVLDIHGTDSNCGIFTIVTNPTPANMLLAYSLPISKIVVWGSKDNSRAAGPLSRYVHCGVGIECGPKNMKLVSNELTGLLKTFLSDQVLNYREVDRKELYQVFGSIKEGEISKQQKEKLKDFEEISINNQTFSPILVGQYKDEKIICYKMRRVNFYQKFSFSY